MQSMERKHIVEVDKLMELIIKHKAEDGTAVVLVCAGPDQNSMSRIFSTVKFISKQQ